jgi:D-amino-acid dehydrogenase
MNLCGFLVGPSVLCERSRFPLVVWQFAPSRQIQNGGRLWRSSSANHYFAFSLLGGRRRSNVLSEAASNAALRKEESGGPPPVRIGIVGGGIAGVSVAHALSQRKLPLPAMITILEGDSSPIGEVPVQENTQSPAWIAATARNANSLVPGVASGAVLSQRPVVYKAIGDTVREWCYRQGERLRDAVVAPDDRKLRAGMLKKKAPRSEDFAVPPPYFALHPVRCLGPTADPVERRTFVRFMSNFLYASFVLGQRAAQERGRTLALLAKANRLLYLREAARPGNGGDHSQGFLSLYRDRRAAEHSAGASREQGEDAELLTWEQALEYEPRLSYLPIQNLHAVRKKNDHTASCEHLVRQWITEDRGSGLDYRSGDVNKIQVLRNGDRNMYKVTSKDGSTHEFDILVLAAGANTPLLASQMGLGKYCPTYPLRGFSLTVLAWEQEKNKKGQKKQPLTLLQQPFSLDSIYITSVSPFTARLAGFGEFAGYRDKAADVPSLGPMILSRYARAVLPEAIHASERDAVPCFRPLSPDDLPVVGEIPSRPGLFVHTGHGTLGWTLGLATGECIAQAIADRMEGKDTQTGTFTLADGTKIDRKVLSPKRFASKFKSPLWWA